MSIPPDLFAKIESERFSALAGLASGVGLFLRTVSEQPEVKELINAVRDEQSRRELAERAILLASQEFDRSYQHPHDTAVAVYLWVLTTKDDDLAREVARHVLPVGGWWWVFHVAEKAEIGFVFLS